MLYEHDMSCYLTIQGPFRSQGLCNNMTFYDILSSDHLIEPSAFSLQDVVQNSKAMDTNLDCMHTF